MTSDEYMTNVSYTKYPSTPYLRGSRSHDAKDQVVGPDIFDGKHVVVTEKMDGENTTMYRDHIHARSIDGRHHPSRDWVKGFHGSIKHNIPEGWRICGENVYAEHSIFYDSLPSYFLGFSIWTADDICVEWKDTLEMFEEWGITPVPELYHGPYIADRIIEKIDALDYNTQEGVVVRNYYSFTLSEFSENVAKFVRPNHVQTDEHWTKKKIVPNRLA